MLSGRRGCLSDLSLVASLFVIGLVGHLWVASTLPETSRSLFGTVLAADVARAAVYGLALLLPAGLAATRLRGLSNLWGRGVILALAAAGGHALLLGEVLAVDRALPWPGLPAAVRPLLTLLYGSAILLACRKRLLKEKPGATLALGMGLGALASGGWAIAGALGTWSEIGLAILEALGISLLCALFMALVVSGDEATLARPPMRSGLLAAATAAALTPSLFAVRGWSSQGISISVMAAFLSLVAGALLVLEQPAQPRRAWWGVWAFWWAALVLPLLFTKGAEGDWVPGGLPAATGQAGLFGILFGVGVGGLLFAARPWLPRLVARPRLAARSGLAAAFGSAALALVAVLYALYGRVGVQPDTFFVVMAHQADTSFARQIKNRDARVAAVYSTLTQQALTDQANLRAYLDARGVTYRGYYLINGLEVAGNPLLRLELARRPDVARILDSPHFRPQPPLRGPLRLAEERQKKDALSWGVAFVHADQVWARWNVTGKGIIVGAMGSGVDWLHPDISAQYLGAAGQHDYTWFDPWEGTTAPVDTNGIGTHVVGTMVGANGIGVAPGARWIACRSLARDFGNPALYLDCMQFLFAPFPLRGNPFIDGDPSRGAHIVLGGWICPAWEGCDAITFPIAIQHLRDAGQLFVAGAGNDGPACGTIVTPGSAAAALTVGAVDARGVIANFSSRGPVTLDGSLRAKPDVLAPGVGIISSLPDGRYAEFNGTSMAAAHVVGLVALLWSADPALIGDIDQTVKIIAETAQAPVVPAAAASCAAGAGQPHSAYGIGVVDALAAVRLALHAP